MKKKEGRQVAFCFCSLQEEHRDWWIWFISRNMSKRANRRGKSEGQRMLDAGISEDEQRQVDLNVQMFESLLFLKAWKSYFLSLEDAILSLFSVTVLFGLERRALEKQFHCDAIQSVRLLEEYENLPNGPAITDRNGLHCFVLEVKESAGVNSYVFGVNSLKRCVVLVAKINSFLSHHREGFPQSHSSSASSSSSPVPLSTPSTSLPSTPAEESEEKNEDLSKEAGKEEQHASPPLSSVEEAENQAINEPVLDLSPPLPTLSEVEQLIPVPDPGVFIPMMEDEKLHDSESVLEDDDEEGSFL